MARRRTPARDARAVEPVSWRDGVHVTGTAIWCDARRARDLCFASSADAVGRAGHGQLIATAPTLALLGATPGAHLVAPYRRPFALGALRLELIPSGHAPGGAALLVEAGAARTLCAGAMAPQGGGLGEPGEVRRCDVLVLGAPYGQPRHVFPPVDAAVDAVLDACARARAAGAVPVVLVTSPSKGLDVAARLVAAGVDVAAHRSIQLAARRLAAVGHPAPAVRQARRGQRGRPGAVVWPLRDRGALAATLGDAPARVVLASGLATEPEAVAAAGADVAVAWSNAADVAGLRALVASTGAARVYLVGRCAADAAAALGGTARVLAPPRQMALFSEGA